MLRNLFFDGNGYTDLPDPPNCPPTSPTRTVGLQIPDGTSDAQITIFLPIRYKMSVSNITFHTRERDKITEFLCH